MLPFTKLIRTVDKGFRREKMVQTVTWMSLVTWENLRSDMSTRASIGLRVIRCYCTIDAIKYYSSNCVVRNSQDSSQVDVPWTPYSLWSYNVMYWQNFTSPSADPCSVANLRYPRSTFMPPFSYFRWHCTDDSTWRKSALYKNVKTRSSATAFSDFRDNFVFPWV